MKLHPKILVVEDDYDSREIVRRNLEREGFEVIEAIDGREGLRQMHQHSPDLVILDINMPQMDGYTVCQRIREVSPIPIIMLTAKTESEDIIKGLELGADDYIVKPFDPKVVVARTRANLRRALDMPFWHTSDTIYSDAYLNISLAERRVLVNNEIVKLSPTEFGLLELLLKASPRVVPYRVLLETVWGFEYIDDVDYLRVYIWHLRRKIEPDPKKPSYIHNELGFGYRFEHLT